MRKIITILLLSVATLCITAQTRRKFDPEAYRLEQRRYILANAQLTSDESTVFFALYDAMRARERQLFDKIRLNRRSRPTTDAECRQAVIDHDNTEIQLKKIQQQYHMKMLRALPPRKVMRCLLLAEKFDRDKLRQKRGR